MSIQFAVTALSYCLGRGKIELRGRQRKPWLILRRGETQRTYLDHQLRRLRREHVGAIDAVWDVVPSEGFYDDYRVCLHGEGLYHVYDMLYPRDTYTITRPVLDLCGMQGLASMWTDRAALKPSFVQFSGGYSKDDCELICDWLDGLGYQATPFSYVHPRSHSTTMQVRVYREHALRMRKDLYPMLHRSIRPGLRWRPGYGKNTPKKNGVRGSSTRSSDFCRFPELATEPPCD